MTAKPNKQRKSEYVQTVVALILIGLIFFGFWFGSQLILHTKINPVIAVTSGSMCITSDMYCDGFSHPFDRTLHTGDLIIIQGVDPKTLNTDYPNSDIIVFHVPADPNGELIVHRIVKVQEINGKLYFYTKGDGNDAPNVWPNPVDEDYDKWVTLDPTVPVGAVSQDLVEGKVVMHIPWLGHIVLALQSAFGSGSTSLAIPIVILIIVLLIIVEVVVPLLRRKQKPAKQQEKPA